MSKSYWDFYENERELPTGKRAGVARMLFTFGLFVGINKRGDYESRYCYEHRDDALKALAAWDGKDDPTGPWITHKPSGRMGPGAKNT